MFRLSVTSFFVLVMSLHPSFAEDGVKPDDSVSYDVAAEDWVVTKNAHVVLDVEASVSGNNAGAMRTDMIKTVNDVAKADWRLTSFSRNLDQTGMERWSVDFDARLPETSLNGLADAVKKDSKAGMQISLASVDFDPTLDEIEATKESLRGHLFKEVNDQLTALNTALSGRSYRISQITFDNTDLPPTPRLMHRNLVATPMMAAAPSNDSGPEHAQKITMTAHVTFAALPPAAPH